MKRHSLYNPSSPFFFSVERNTPVSANQETHFLPKSTLQEPQSLSKSQVLRANKHYRSRTLPLYLTVRSTISPLLICQDLHYMQHLLYPEPRMLVMPSFLCHHMSSFVGLPCLHITVSASPSMHMSWNPISSTIIKACRHALASTITGPEMFSYG
ncbi:DNA mismatch repair mutS [Gossypium arboreum]|uniref:DNA mismatch repair mutS n=1 Tax=Gossypium arboreum TaxID=29729 RepID=A0A0B0N765_GOSAR|nr:DNA mismatch repair mutS [Gossypium arboreum]